LAKNSVERVPRRPATPRCDAFAIATFSIVTLLFHILEKMGYKQKGRDKGKSKQEQSEEGSRTATSEPSADGGKVKIVAEIHQP